MITEDDVQFNEVTIDNVAHLHAEVWYGGVKHCCRRVMLPLETFPDIKKDAVRQLRWHIEQACEPWFLLFEGKSVDGRGNAQYVGRTKSLKQAKAHYTCVSRSPYSFGYVKVATELTCRRIATIADFDIYKGRGAK